MRLVITLIKDNSEEVGENMEPGEIIVFNVSTEEAIDIQNAMSINDFLWLREKFRNLEDTNGEKHNIDISDIYEFEFVL